MAPRAGTEQSYIRTLGCLSLPTRWSCLSSFITHREIMPAGRQLVLKENVQPHPHPHGSAAGARPGPSLISGQMDLQGAPLGLP